MPDINIENPQPFPYDPSMEARVARLEEDMREVKAVLGRLEPIIVRMDSVITATLPTLATKAELAELRSDLKAEIAGVRSDLNADIAAVRSDLVVQLADKPTKTYMWGILGVLTAAYASGLAAMAVIC
jgi:hypothetical protein